MSPTGTKAPGHLSQEVQARTGSPVRADPGVHAHGCVYTYSLACTHMCTHMCAHAHTHRQTFMEPNSASQERCRPQRGSTGEGSWQQKCSQVPRVTYEDTGAQGGLGLKKKKKSNTHPHSETRDHMVTNTMGPRSPALSSRRGQRGLMESQSFLGGGWVPAGPRHHHCASIFPSGCQSLQHISYPYSVLLGMLVP